MTKDEARLLIEAEIIKRGENPKLYHPSDMEWGINELIAKMDKLTQPIPHRNITRP